MLRVQWVTFQILCYSLLCSFFIGCATKGSVSELDERLYQLLKSHDNLQRQVSDIQTQLLQLSDIDKSNSTDRKNLRDNFASFRLELDQFREQYQEQNGELEVVMNRIQQLETNYESVNQTTDKMEKQVAINQERIIGIESHLGLEPSEMLSPKAGTATDTKIEKPKEGTEADMYSSAKAAFDRGDYETAEQGFINLLKIYPKSPNADNAQYWIGEIYYRNKFYAKAILEYQKVIENYPKGNKRVSAFFKQGLAFIEMGEKANARIILNDLIKKFPQSNEAKVAKQKLSSLK
ncbi:MAG: tol-pal system protein YbgF [Desulfobacterales bacterium]|nr:tol-pal system protein YbgF [Desulfobacterales bacterium]